jgi:uncharacterized repeat protein (TIGR02543 family)
MKKQNKLGCLALIGLVAVASIFTVCKAHGSGGDYQGGDGEQVKLWKVTFDAGGGEPAPEAVTVVDGETVGKLPEDPAKDGWTFAGWYLDLEGEQFDPQTAITGDITLRAKWIGAAEAGRFHVTFDGEGGNPATYVRENVVDGGKIDPLPTVERTGYTFGGWWTEEDGAGTPFTTGTLVTSEITVHAKWTVNTYTVTFKDGNGSVIQSGPWNYNATPAYTGATPAKTATAQYIYTWDSANPWNPAIAEATADAVYTARFTQAANIPPTMIAVPGGAFTMGSPESEVDRNSNEGPQHQVTVSSFYMGKHEVTQKEYYDTMGSWPDTAPSDTLGLGDSYPMYNVTWYDAIEYCNRRSGDEGLTPAYTVSGETVTWDKSASGYRLPTEAEWEYACRAGTTTTFSTGDTITTDQVNFDGTFQYNMNPAGVNRGKTTEAGSFAPNDWGLYDMHGNVYEWCWDWYASSYDSGPLTDPDGAVSSNYRVRRGGSWINTGRYLRSAYRSYIYYSDRSNLVGFRLVRP